MCLHVCMYVCMYVVYVCVCVYTHMITFLQLILQKKLGRAPVDEEDGEGQGEELQASPSSVEAKNPVYTIPETPTPPSSATPIPHPATSTPHSMGAPTKRESLVRLHQHQSSMESTSSWTWERRRSSHRMKRRVSSHSNSSRKVSCSSTDVLHAVGGADGGGAGPGSSTLVTKVSSVVSVESDEEIMRPEWALDQIELSDSDSEYFDAQGLFVCLFVCLFV